MERRSFLNKFLLSPPAAAYHLVQKSWRNMFAWGFRKADRASIPVISVGNLLMGGTGKTPFTILLARLLRDAGMNPAVVSRGYRGRSRRPYLVVSDGTAEAPLASPAEAGDEPRLIAESLEHTPVLVGRKRIVAVEAAASLFSTDVAILDDGFQHLTLRRELDIVLLNGAEDRMFPLGRLREPISSLRRADILVLAGPTARIPSGAEKLVKNKPVFRCQAAAVSVATGGAGASPEAPDIFSDREVVLASGIANPDRFRETALELGWKVKKHHRFRDHHRFSDQELTKLLAAAAGLPLVFTEKDWVKLPAWIRTNETTAALRIGMTMEEEKPFLDTVTDLLRRGRA